MNKTTITIKRISELISSGEGIPTEVAFQKNRKREYVLVRQLIMYFSRKYTKNSLREIGREIASKDHATVLHACKTIQNLSDTDRLFRKRLLEYDEKIVTEMNSGKRQLIYVYAPDWLLKRGLATIVLMESELSRLASESPTVAAMYKDIKAVQEARRPGEKNLTGF